MAVRFLRLDRNILRFGGVVNNGTFIPVWYKLLLGNHVAKLDFLPMEGLGGEILSAGPAVSYEQPLREDRSSSETAGVTFAIVPLWHRKRSRPQRAFH